MASNPGSQSKKKILVISPVPSHPQNSGNRIRIYNMLKILQNLGYLIEFLYVDKESNSKHVVKKADTSKMMEDWDHFYYFSVVSAGSKENFKQKEYSKSALRFKKNKISIESFLTFLVEKVDDQIGKFGWKLYKLNPSLYNNIRKIILGEKQSLLSSKCIVSSDYIPTPPARKGKQFKNSENSLGDIKLFGKSKELNIDDWYPEKLDNFLSHLVSENNYHAVICEYVYFSHSLLQFDDQTLKIIDTHDCFAFRNERLAKFNLQNRFFSTTPKEEGKGLERADIVIAIQDEERQIFEKECKKPVATVGHNIQINIKPIINPNGKSILYVGSGNEGNKQAVDFFIAEIWPLVLKLDQNIHLTLAGGICMHYDQIPNCELTGEVASIELLYHNADLAINTAIIGTGLKIKTIEALGFGLPMICTSHSAIGIDCEKAGLIIADYPKAFAFKIIELLNDYKLRIELSKKGIKYAQAYNENIIRSLELIFDK